MTSRVGVGVIGARSMVAERAILPALELSSRARAVAVAAAGGPVADRWAHLSVASYDAVIDHPEVEVVYIPLPNSMHAEWTSRAAAAGKHVLVEKPIAATQDDAASMIQACDEAGVLLAEAWMTPFDHRWSQMFDLVDDGVIGTVREIDACFTFTIGAESSGNYRWRPELGGGALLDVGIYCLGPAVRLWGASPCQIGASVVMSPSGVDATTSVELTWPDGQMATARCSFVEDEMQRLEIVGDDGRLVASGDAHTGGLSAASIEHHDARGVHDLPVESNDPYLAMLDAFAGAVRGTSTWPRPAHESLAMIRLLEEIRQVAK